MKLGIVITGAETAAAAGDLARAAADRGHQLRGFLTDSGVRALENEGIGALVAAGRMTLAVCELSMERLGQAVPERIAEAVVIGGQYQDAELAHWCDRVVVF